MASGETLKYVKFILIIPPTMSFLVLFVFRFRALVPPCGSCTEMYLSPQSAPCSETTLLFLCPPVIKNSHSPRAREVSLLVLPKLYFYNYSLFKEMSFLFIWKLPLCAKFTRIPITCPLPCAHLLVSLFPSLMSWFWLLFIYTVFANI